MFSTVLVSEGVGEVFSVFLVICEGVGLIILLANPSKPQTMHGNALFGEQFIYDHQTATL